jgi:8-oxo-dGTP pyrophosphatase MutT (NUDIX family)
MSQPGRAKPPTRVDTAWQIAYRLGFPLARIWWRWRRRRHEGALVAIHVGSSLLLLRSSYRRTWNFPGGSVRRGEPPEAAARRELAEEIGLVPDRQLRPVGEVCGVWDGRQDRVFLFALRLEQLPALRLDHREIIGARLVALEALPGLPLTGPVRAYVDGLAAGAGRGSVARHCPAGAPAAAPVGTYPRG